MKVNYPITVEDDSPFPLENIPFGVFSTESNVSLLVIFRLPSNHHPASTADRNYYWSICFGLESPSRKWTVQT